MATAPKKTAAPKAAAPAEKAAPAKAAAPKKAPGSCRSLWSDQGQYGGRDWPDQPDHWRGR